MLCLSTERTHNNFGKFNILDYYVNSKSPTRIKQLVAKGRAIAYKNVNVPNIQITVY